MGKLAINGGQKVRNELFPSYDVIGKEEEEAAVEVIRSGVLSKFLGCWDDDFYGGPHVRALEEEWADYFKIKNAISVNSATSALYCAMGAIGIQPGDEVIVSPYTMCASATAPLIYGAIPIFADIERDYYCLDPDSIEQRITPRTKAIIVVNIFGQPHDAKRIREIAKKHNLKIIEDNAQGPGAKYNGQYTGTLGDIGVFSLNYHKHIHCGEGGIAVTNDDVLAERMRLIRNHAEAVIDDKGYDDLVNMVGFNLRMTEIEAAISRQQLKKLKGLVEERIENVNYLSNKLSTLPGLKPAIVREGCTHVYYMHPLTYEISEVGIEREKFVEAVKAELMPTKRRETEGVRVEAGYAKPLYMLSLYRKKMAFGRNGYPFNKNPELVYTEGLCPVCEDIQNNKLILHDLMRPGMKKKDLDDVYDAFEKVVNNKDELL